MRQEINKILAKYGEEIGVEFTAGNASYTLDFATIKLNIKVNEKSEAAKEKEENAMLSKLFGFEESIIGKSFRVNGDRMTIIEINSRNKKYPIIVKNSKNGKQYKMIPEYVKAKLSV